MPKYDGTGPRGKGPMTGHGGGRCVVPLNTGEQELEFLKNQEQALKRQLKRVEAEIKRSGGQTSTKELTQ